MKITYRKTEIQSLNNDKIGKIFYNSHNIVNILADNCLTYFAVPPMHSRSNFPLDNTISNNQ